MVNDFGDDNRDGVIDDNFGDDNPDGVIDDNGVGAAENALVTFKNQRLTTNAHVGQSNCKLANSICCPQNFLGA